MQNRNAPQRERSMQEYARTRNWLNVTEWARSGFSKHGDFLRCFCCSSIIRPTQGDDPWKAHATCARFPHCINVIAEKGINFINQAYVTENDGFWAPSIVQRCQMSVNFRNVVNIRAEEFQRGREVQIYEHNPQGVQRFLSPALLYHLKDTYRGMMMEFCTLTGKRYRDPMEAAFLSFDARKDTFVNIQGEAEMPTSQDMAAAGFIYTGERTCRCYYCGSIISDWYVNDDPWERHAILNKGCYHVIFSKGEDYIRKANG
ncbi:uncharacterized protein LOC128239199 [Mya arenaria]|uniref:uncharacterized protein LOC128239199 n=1 Tax=Mya arenaria TaxID=6604 RepID=UPI0022E77D0D|nr:uncharacterized protein LOC128239199 [Mya arenaria]XP_052811680.1 uncharacterized protein LOC128239199 [Mya arenaria]